MKSCKSACYHAKCYKRRRDSILHTANCRTITSDEVQYGISVRNQETSRVSAAIR